MKYIQRSNTLSLKGLAKFALPFFSSLAISAVLTACSVSTPQEPQPVFQNTDNTKNLFTLDLLEGDTQAALEEEYDAEVLVWKPEAGFAILGSALESDLLPQSLQLDSNKNSIELPISALGDQGWIHGLNGWSEGETGWSEGETGWSEGETGWSEGNNGWIEGDNGWALGVNNVYLKRNQSAWDQIDLFAAHASSSTLGQGIKIAVIDTGVDLNHPMLAESLAPTNEWRDYVDYDLIPQDRLGGQGSGHGTAVAGLILQVAPQATILPIRVLNEDGLGDMDHVIYAIDHAVKSGATIINLSLGSAVNSWTLRKMLRYAKSQGVVTVAAAGNTGSYNNLVFPAKISSSPNFKGSVFAVGSIDQDYAVSEFSTSRSDNIIFAPGQRIRTIFPGRRLATVSGTSFSTPLVAGSLALAYSELDTDTKKQDLHSYVLSGVAREQIVSRHYQNSESWKHGNGILDTNSIVNTTKIFNPNFETANQLDQWNTQNTVVVQNFNQQNYTRSGKNISKIARSGYVRQNITGLQPNTTYEVQILMGFDKNWGKANISIKNFRGKYYSRADIDIPVTGKVNKLGYATLTFTTGEENTSGLLEIANRSSSNLFLDELHLKAIAYEFSD